jgi:hypothetical protein
MQTISTAYFSRPLRRSIQTKVTLRSLSIVSLLAALAIGGYLFVTQARETGPTSDLGQRAQTQATQSAAGTSFQAAAPVLQAHFAENGTYAGATLPPAYGVVVARADATSYCLQTPDGGQHVVGPAGTPAPGPC